MFLHEIKSTKPNNSYNDAQVCTPLFNFLKKTFFSFICITKVIHFNNNMTCQLYDTDNAYLNKQVHEITNSMEFLYKCLVIIQNKIVKTKL